jgi:transposase
VKRQRRAYRKWVAEIVASRLRFVDEAGVHLSLTRLCGRATPGKRVVEAVPPQPGGPSWTLLGALGVRGASAPWVLQGAVDGVAFEVYVREVLGPTLQPGEIVVMDNLSVHKVSGIAGALTARGAQVHFLPPYSQDLNPIEQCWSKVKTALRTAKARSFDALLDALKAALQTVTTEDAIAWFTYCGYTVHA